MAGRHLHRHTDILSKFAVSMVMTGDYEDTMSQHLKCWRLKTRQVHTTGTRERSRSAPRPHSGVRGFKDLTIRYRQKRLGFKARRDGLGGVHNWARFPHTPMHKRTSDSRNATAARTWAALEGRLPLLQLPAYLAHRPLSARSVPFLTRLGG